METMIYECNTGLDCQECIGGCSQNLEYVGDDEFQEQLDKYIFDELCKESIAHYEDSGQNTQQIRG
jgi:hypothetical protein